jgi:hypothetical protein
MCAEYCCCCLPWPCLITVHCWLLLVEWPGESLAISWVLLCRLRADVLQPQLSVIIG